MSTLLPAPITRFVGRARELNELRGLLQTAQLITLTGPGGSGKTRLAVQLASTYSLPAHWIDLVALFDPEQLAVWVRHELGLEERPARSAREIVLEHLREQAVLLILDNCEQISSSVADLAQAILEQCPSLKILTTSVQPLNLACEKVYAVPPLALEPQPDQLSSSSAELSDALQLFLDRAREAMPQFELTAANAATIETICRRLDGWPLAIELAAARVKMLSIVQIADRLENTFQLLTRGTAAQVPRHQALRAVMEWSYQYLSHAEQSLLRRLAIFVGSFALETVEAVCDLQDLHASPLDVLSDLADKSWLVIVPSSQGSLMRYRLLEPIRQYAREQLSACGELALVQQRLLEWGNRLAEQAEPQLTGPDQTRWLEDLERELDHLRVALRWATATAAAPEVVLSGLRLAGALERLWWVHDHVSEGRAWLSALLAGNIQSADAVRAKALFTAGVLAYRQSDYVAADAYLREALELRRRLGDERGMAFVLNNLGSIALERGDHTHAESLYSQALDLRRGLNDEWGIASSLNNLGTAVFAQGDYVRATSLYEESLNLYRRLGDSWSIASTLNNLGETQRRLGHSVSARALFEQSLELRRSLGDQRGVALVLFNWAGLTLDEHHWAKTAALLIESMTLLQVGHNLSDWVRGLERYALLRVRQKQWKGAARLYGAAEALRRRLGASRAISDSTAHAQGLAEVQAQLDAQSFAAAWTLGQTLTVEQATAEVLSDPAPASEPDQDERSLKPSLLRICALGLAQVTVGEHTLSSADWTYTKAKELFFYFIVHPAATKAQIGLDIWPEVSAEQLRNIFHRALHHLRKALGQPDWVIFADDVYSFNRALNYWCDVDLFEQHLQLARTPDRAAAIQHTEAAIQLWQGDFAEDLDAGDWIIFQREALRQRYMQALLDLGAWYYAAADYERAIVVYRRLLGLDGYLELAHREVMRCFVRQGEASHALQHYQHLRDMLHQELQTDPSPETALLYERIRRGDEI